MDREFNLIDKPWICVRDNGCEVKEISIRQVFEHAQDYTELAGETKTQDMAVLRFLACGDLHGILKVRQKR